MTPDTCNPAAPLNRAGLAVLARCCLRCWGGKLPDGTFIGLGGLLVVKSDTIALQRLIPPH